MTLDHSFNTIISVKNICEAWCEFICGKKTKKDVAEFYLNLPKNMFTLHNSLKSKTYKHGSYEAFSISDPKPRSIHKAMVRDRLLHYAMYRILYSYFDKKFIYDSYSCRENKGTHRARDRFVLFARKVSRNNIQTCRVLKCDIRKFFASIDHEILFKILEKHISDQDTLWLLRETVRSFHSTEHGKGLPLGSLTSQLLVNIYMNEFDQFMKHKLKVRYYIRYADDFVVLNEDRDYLLRILKDINLFLKDQLLLTLHPNKVYIKTYSSGVDFLGWIHFPYHKILRTTTKRRMIRNLISKSDKKETVKSYKGMLKHGNTYKLRQKYPILYP